MKVILIVFVVLVFTAIALSVKRKEMVPDFTDDNCIRAIVGEFDKNDYQGLRLMAHAIRNRGTLKGVKGFPASFLNHTQKMVWVTASLAWFDTFNEYDILEGATEWRNTEDVRRGKTPYNMQLVKVYKGLYFYKKPKTGGITE